MKNILSRAVEQTSPQVIILSGFYDVDAAVEILRHGNPVIVNAASVERRDGYRAIDFLSGFVFALNGKYRRIDDMIYRFEI